MIETKAALASGLCRFLMRPWCSKGSDKNLHFKTWHTLVPGRRLAKTSRAGFCASFLQDDYEIAVAKKAETGSSQSCINHTI